MKVTSTANGGTGDRACIHFWRDDLPGKLSPKSGEWGQAGVPHYFTAWVKSADGSDVEGSIALSGYSECSTGPSCSWVDDIRKTFVAKATWSQITVGFWPPISNPVENGVHSGIHRWIRNTPATYEASVVPHIANKAILVDEVTETGPMTNTPGILCMPLDTRPECNDGVVVIPDPTRPDIPVVTPPAGGHYLEHGNPTDLKNASDWGCLTNVGTTLGYAANDGGRCLIVDPILQDDGTWMLALLDEEVAHGCLSWSGSFAVISNPCATDRTWIEKRIPTTNGAYLIQLSPKSDDKGCLNRDLQLVGCDVRKLDQIWQDGLFGSVLNWAKEHKCALALAASLIEPWALLLAVAVCSLDDWKEVLKGVASAYTDAKGIWQCVANGTEQAKQCATGLWALTTPYPTPTQLKLRMRMIEGMVKDCIDNPERCIGEVIGSIITAAISAEIKSLAVTARAARVEAKAASQVGDIARAAAKEAEAAADEWIAKGLVEEDSIFRGNVCTPGAALSQSLVQTNAIGGGHWCKAPTTRGLDIEREVFDNEYKQLGYANMNDHSRYWPLFDFIKDRKIVSFKTTDFRSSTALRRLENHLDDLIERGFTVTNGSAGRINEVHLDVRVQAGYSGSLNPLIARAGRRSTSLRKVTVSITVYP